MVAELSGYDVFLSHNSVDNTSVETLARRLEKEAGLRPYLGRGGLAPGDPGQEAGQEALEEAIHNSSSVAVFLGPSGLGPWLNEEMRAALDVQIKDRALRVIPVLLPGSLMPEKGRLPRFLSRRTWVDFRPNLDDADAFHLLVCGIRGVAPRSGLAAAQFGDHPPYRGLEAFHPEDAAWFFGRESETQLLVERLKSSRFLSVLGASGSGKSSLVLAGLVPSLRRGALPGSAGWKEIIFTPTAQPLEELAVRLAVLLPETVSGSWLRELEAEPRSLHLAIRQAFSGAPASQQVLIVVDQFEEVFTLCKQEAARRMFFDNLLYAADVQGGRAVVVITMRADFLGKVAGYPELADRVSTFQFLVTSLEGEQVRQVIEQPAQMAGLQFEPGLVEQILSDVSEQPGMLPLLEHALYELWVRRVENRLTFSAYNEIGKVAGALIRTADAVYESLDENQRLIARRILLKLVQPGEGTEDTRRRALASELAATAGQVDEVELVLTCLADQRLITTSSEVGTEGTFVEVAHEALIHNWPRYREWVEQDRQSLIFQRHLREAAEDWRRLGRDEGILFRGARLAELRSWAAEHAGDMDLLEREFAAACDELDAREKAEAEEQRRLQMEAEADKLHALRMRRRAVYLALTLGITALALVMAGILAWKTFVLSRSTRANQLAAQALTNEEKELDLSLLLAVEAYNREDTPTAYNTLLSVLEYSPNLDHFLNGQDAKVLALSYSPQKKLLASAGPGQKITLWRWQRDETAGIDTFVPVEKALSGHTGEIRGLDFDPTGRYLASAGMDRRVILWNVDAALSPDLQASQPVSLTLTEQKKELLSVAYSPSGETLVAAGLGKYVFIWKDASLLWDDPGVRSRLQKIENPHKDVYSFAIHPSDRLLITGTADSWLSVFDISTSQADITDTIKDFQANLSGIASLSFDADGKNLVAGTNSTVISIYSTRNLTDTQVTRGGESQEFLRGHKSRVNSLVLLPGRKFVASASTDRSIILWNASQKLIVEQLLGHSQGIGVMELVSPCEGCPEMLVSGANERSLILWDLFPASPEKLPQLKLPGDLHSLAFDPGSMKLAAVLCGRRDEANRCIDAGVVIRDLRSGEEQPAPDFLDGGTSDRLAFNTEHSLFAAASCLPEAGAQACEKSSLRVWKGGEPVGTGGQFAQVPGTVKNLVISPDGRMLAAGICTEWNDQRECIRGQASLWAIEGAKQVPLADAPPEGETGGESVPASQEYLSVVEGLAFSQDGKILAAGGCADIAEERVVVRQTEVVRRKCIQGEIRRWETASGAALGPPVPAHNDWVTSLAFSPKGEKGEKLASASCRLRDLGGICILSEIRLWDAATWGQIGLPLHGQIDAGPVLSLGFPVDENHLVSVNASGGVYQWDLSPAALLRRACIKAGRNLAESEWQQYFPQDPYRQTCPQWP